MAALTGFLCNTGFSFAGGDSSGGGTVLTRGKFNVLLELDLYANKNHIPFPLKKALGLPSEMKEAKVGLHTFKIQDDPAFERAAKRLELWESDPQSSALILAIRNTIKNTFYFSTRQTLPLLSQYDLDSADETVSLKDLKTVVLYHPKVGAVFSVPTYSKMDDLSKAALIIHEALRQIQFAYGETQFTNATLQEITARIFLSKPDSHRPLADGLNLGEFLNSAIRSGDLESSIRYEKLRLSLVELADSLPQIQELQELTRELPLIPASDYGKVSWHSRFFHFYELIHSKPDEITLQMPNLAQKNKWMRLWSAAGIKLTEEEFSILEKGEPDLYSIEFLLSQIK